MESTSDNDRTTRTDDLTRGCAACLRAVIERAGGLVRISEETGTTVNSLYRYVSSDTEAALMRYWKILSVSLAAHTPIEQMMCGQGDLDWEDAARTIVRNEASEAYKFAQAYADCVVASLKTGTAPVVRRTRTRKQVRAIPVSRLAEGEDVDF